MQASGVRCRHSPRTIKVVNEGPHPACAQLKSGQSDGQLKTPRPSASRVEIHHPINGLDPWLMRVSRNDYVNSTRTRIELQFLQVVQNVDGASAEPYYLRVGKVLRPVAGIDVPSDRSHRCNPAEPGDNIWASDIAGVDDMRDAGEP